MNSMYEESFQRCLFTFPTFSLRDCGIALRQRRYDNK